MLLLQPLIDLGDWPLGSCSHLTASVCQTGGVKPLTALGLWEMVFVKGCYHHIKLLLLQM